MSEEDQPIWQTIKTFFTDTDIAHMTPRGFTLAKFAAAKSNSDGK